MNRVFVDAASLAEDSVAAIQLQIEMFTRPPRNIAWSPVIRHRAAIGRRVIDQNVTAVDLFGNGNDEAAVRTGQLSEEDLAELRSWHREDALALQFTGQDAGVLKLWGKYKVVHSIDPALWAELADADDDTLIPEGTLTKLPYPDPFIALPEPIVIPAVGGSQGHLQRIEGFFLTGRFSIGLGYLPTSTTKAHGDLSLLICSRIVRPDGSQVRTADGRKDVSWTRLGISEGMTVGQMCESTRETFQVAARGLDWENEIILSLRRCVAVILYLCATNADLQPVKAPPAKRVKGKPTKRRPQVVNVGFRLGAALRAYYASAAPRERTEPTGRKVRPHVRRAHFHTFRVGPGRPNQRTQTEIRWVSATGIGFDKNADKVTVNPVPAGAKVKAKEVVS
jgi:hypothetical protein